MIHLRGDIVPIIDWRLKLGHRDVRYDGSTVVVGLNVRGRIVGAVVDSVSDVVDLPANAITPAPTFSAAVNNAFIQGIATRGQGPSQRMLILMHFEQLLSDADLNAAPSITH